MRLWKLVVVKSFDYTKFILLLKENFMPKDSQEKGLYGEEHLVKGGHYKFDVCHV